MKYGLVTAGHPHELSLEHKKELFKCDGCKQVGFGWRYSCNETGCALGGSGGFHLHKACLNTKSRLTHNLYEGRIFEFRDKGNQCKYCDACGGDFDGIFYQGYWDGKGFLERPTRELHVCCMALQPQISFSEFIKQEGKRNRITSGTDEVASDDISDVVLVLDKKLPSSIRCAICCQKKVDGNKTWAYVSTCSTFGYHVHCLRSKVNEMLEILPLQGNLEGTATTGLEEMNWMESLFGSGASSAFELLPAPVKSRKKTTAYGSHVSRIIKISKILLAIVVAVFIGEPVTAILTALTTLVSQ